MPTIEELGRLTKAKYPEYADMKDADVGRRVKAKFPNDYADFTGNDPGFLQQAALAQQGMAEPQEAAPPKEPGFLQQAAHAGLMATPTILAGLVGGGAAALAAPLAAPTLGVAPVAAGTAGAALGGHLGQNIVDAVQTARGHGPKSGADAAKRANDEALMQGAYELGGRGLAKGASLAARPLMELAVKFTPEVAQTALREGVAATTKGLDRLLKRIKESGDATRSLVEYATRKGQRYDGVAIAREAYQELAADFEKMPISNPTRKALAKYTKRFLKENGSDITPTRLHMMKQVSDDIADPILTAQKRGDMVAQGDLLWARWHKAFADRARITLDESIGKIPGSVEPSLYHVQNRRTSQLLALKEAIWPQSTKQFSRTATMLRSVARPAAGAATGAAIGGTMNPNHARGIIEGAAVGSLLGSPAATSQAALALNNRLIQLGLKNSARVIAAADAVSR